MEQLYAVPCAAQLRLSMQVTTDGVLKAKSTPLVRILGLHDERSVEVSSFTVVTTDLHANLLDLALRCVILVVLHVANGTPGRVPELVRFTQYAQPVPACNALQSRSS